MPSKQRPALTSKRDEINLQQQGMSHYSLIPLLVAHLSRTSSAPSCSTASHAAGSASPPSTKATRKATSTRNTFLDRLKGAPPLVLAVESDEEAELQRQPYSTAALSPGHHTRSRSRSRSPSPFHTAPSPHRPAPSTSRAEAAAPSFAHSDPSTDLHKKSTVLQPLPLTTNAALSQEQQQQPPSSDDSLAYVDVDSDYTVVEAPALNPVSKPRASPSALRVMREGAKDVPWWATAGAEPKLASATSPRARGKKPSSSPFTFHVDPSVPPAYGARPPTPRHASTAAPHRPSPLHPRRRPEEGGRKRTNEDVTSMQGREAMLASFLKVEKVIKARPRRRAVGEALGQGRGEGVKQEDEVEVEEEPREEEEQEEQEGEQEEDLPAPAELGKAKAEGDKKQKKSNRSGRGKSNAQRSDADDLPPHLAPRSPRRQRGRRSSASVVHVDPSSSTADDDPAPSSEVEV